MRNNTIGVWMWQRLWKFNGQYAVIDCLAETEDDKEFSQNPWDEEEFYDDWHWLCPKPNLVLVHEK